MHLSHHCTYVSCAFLCGNNSLDCFLRSHIQRFGKKKIFCYLYKYKNWIAKKINYQNDKKRIHTNPLKERNQTYPNVGGYLFLIQFLYKIIAEKGDERMVTVVVLSLVLIFSVAYFLGLFFKSVLSEIKAKLPESSKLWFRVIGKILDYIFAIILGMVIYHFWLEDWKFTAFIFSILFIQNVVDIVSAERKKVEA